MKVCFLCGGFSTNGGIGRVLSILTTEMLRNKDDLNIVFCSLWKKSEEQNYLIDNRCVRKELFPHRISMLKALTVKNAIGKLSSYIKNEDIDLIVACGALFYPLGIIAARKTGINCICWEHTDPNNNRDYRFQDFARAFGAKRSYLNVVLTKAALEVYKTRFPRVITMQIYNPIDPMLLRNTYEYNVDSTRIISVGRLRPQKNFSKLLDIASIVLKNHPGWEWDIFGEGPLREELEKKRDSLRLNGKVHFKGQVSDLYERYHEYSFMVMTSDYEGFPMALLEGAANQLPLIAFNVPTGPNEIIRNGVNGYLSTPNEVDEICKYIVELMQKKELRQSMAVKSKEIAKSFDVKEVSKEWIDILERAIYS